MYMVTCKKASLLIGFAIPRSAITVRDTLLKHDMWSLMSDMRINNVHYPLHFLLVRVIADVVVNHRFRALYKLECS